MLPLINMEGINLWYPVSHQNYLSPKKAVNSDSESETNQLLVFRGKSWTKTRNISEISLITISMWKISTSIIQVAVFQMGRVSKSNHKFSKDLIRITTTIWNHL